MKRAKAGTPALPSKEDLLAFVHTQPGKVGVREVARRFGLKNADRAALRGALRDLAEAGEIASTRKALHHPGQLPPVVLADVTVRDRDGELLAIPTEWDEEARGPPPKIRIRTLRRMRARHRRGVGDRILVRVELQHGDEAAPYAGRIINCASTAPSNASSASTARCRTAVHG